MEFGNLRFMRRRVLALCAVAALFVVACGSSGAGSGSGSGSNQGGTLTVAEGTDADTLDPASQTTTIVGSMVEMVAEPLV
ncbi:MAG: ABC transporter substrate-binding protein, partial [Candidatus Dormibacteraceae bacterium]